MLFIWKAVLARVRYSKDLQGLHANLDTWQLADETWHIRTVIARTVRSCWPTG